MSCVVPNCKVNKYGYKERYSTFQVPADENLRKKWAANIPGIHFLRKSQRVCENHFEEHLMIKKYVHHDNNGKVILEVPLQRTRLKPGAIPSIFESNLSARSKSPQVYVVNRTNACHTDHSYALKLNESTHSSEFSGVEIDSASVTSNFDTSNDTSQNGIMIEQTSFCENVPQTFQSEHVTDSDVTANDTWQNEIIEQSSFSEKVPQTFESQQACDVTATDTLVLHSNFTHERSPHPMPRIENTIENLEFSSSSTFNLSEKEHAVDERINSEFSYVNLTFDSVTFSFNTLSDEVNSENHVFLKVPKPWNVCKSINGNEEILIFTYIVQMNNYGMNKHIFEKTLIIKASREIVYEVYSTPVDVSATKLPQILNSISALEDILIKFKHIRVCKGIRISNLDFIRGNTSLKTTIGTDWRHNDCTVLSLNNERCSACRKYSKTLSQQVRRGKNKNIKRIFISSNPVDQMKLKALRKKMKFRARVACQLKQRQTRGGLIHANSHFFNLIQYVEQCFSKHASNSRVFDLTVDEVLDNYNFTFPSKDHGADILSYAVYYYIRLRMRQFTYQENQKVKKVSIVKRKLAKLSNV